MHLRFFLVFAFLCLIFSIPVFAQSNEDLQSNFSELISVAERYESGELTFLQLRVLMNSFREKLYANFYSQQKVVVEEPPSNEKLFSLFDEAEKAFLKRDLKKLDLILNEIEAEFKAENNEEALKLLTQIREALAKEDLKRVAVLGEKLDSLFREESRRDEFNFRGWSAEEVQKVFGQPTGSEEWVWVENLQKSVRVKNPLPRWEKTIFEGKKIRIMFNAFPHMAEYKDSLQAFYWIDFQMQFKTAEEEINAKQLLQDINNSLYSYLSSKREEDLQSLASKTANYQRVLNDFLWKNKDSCEKLMTSFFEKSSGVEEQLEWRGVLFESDEGVIYWVLNENLSQQWHGFNTYLDFRFSKPMEFEFPFERENLEDLSDEELLKRMRNILHDIKSNAARHVEGGSLGVKRIELENIVNALTERVNREDLQSSLTVTDLTARFEQLFNEFTSDFKKEKISQTNYRRELFKNEIQRTNSYCQSKEEFCGQENSCKNAECISALGGNEKNSFCKDELDNDDDGFRDCEDPDCVDFKDCGRLCEKTCGGENGCWNCSGTQCKTECDACSQCNEANPNNPQACESVCSTCNNCNESKCSSVCDPCYDCQDEFYGGGCRKSCKQWNSCLNQVLNNNLDNQCNSLYPECVKCNYDKGNWKCDSPRIVDPQTFNCECPQINCLEGQYLDGESCQCKGEIQPSQPTKPIQPPLPGESMDKNKPVPVKDENALRDANLLVDSKLNGVASFLPITSFITALDSLVSEPLPPSCENIKCNANQLCNSERGWCQCQQGWFDVDGDWLNGCESREQKSCETDSDCASPRCSEDKRNTVSFRCVKSDSWPETISQFEMGGNCGKKTSGEFHGGIWFNGWGQEFEKFNEFRQQSDLQLNNSWCEKELKDAVQERIELQNSLNNDFSSWFFSELVEKNPNQFRFHGESIRFVYESFLQNTDKIARNLNCLGKTEWPSEAQLLSFEFESSNGKVRFFEKFSETTFFSEGKNKKLNVLSPYMKTWFFPSKEEFKKMIAEEFKREIKGPTPEDIELMRQVPEVVGLVNRISDRFGGQARIAIKIADKEELVSGMLFTVDKEKLIQVKAIDETTSLDNLSVTVLVEFDYFYNLLSTIIKEVEGEQEIKPYWEEEGFRPPSFNDVSIPIKMFTQIILGIFTGQVKVEPLTQVPNIILSLQDIMSLMKLGGTE